MGQANRWATGTVRLAHRFGPVGMVGAAGLYFVSLTPSLLPRPWLLQGLLSGLLAGLGHGLGVASGRLVRRAWTGDVLRVAAVLLGILFTWQGFLWQRAVCAAVGVPPPSIAAYTRVPIIAGLCFLALLAISHAVRAVVRALARYVTTVVSVVLVTVTALSVVVVTAWGAMVVMNTNFRNTDESTGPDRPPAQAERSGSATSLVSWDSLGALGRVFVGNGPTAADIARFTGTPARQPIRVYAGRKSAPSLHEEAVLAVRELERTGAFSRAVLCVATSTGRGLVDENYLEPLEYMYGGDTAVVSMQYSYQASWLSFLTDRDQVRTAARELFDQVHERWARLPAGQRPRLLVFGESLGAYGADSVFQGLGDMRSRVDGALFVGPPHDSPNWARFVAGRDPGTSLVRPRLGGGAQVRFGESAGDLAEPGTAWEPPRIAYLQHSSDPVVWWSPDLLWHAPDRGGTWLPVVTFCQVTTDLAVGNDFPSGHGHNYRDDAISAWAQIVPPPGWTGSRGAQLRFVLTAGR